MGPEGGPVAADGEPVQVDCEQDDQDDAEPERGHPEAHEREQSDGVVAGPVLVRGGERRQRHGDDDREERRHDHERSGQGEAGRDEGGHRRLVFDRGAKVAVQEVVEVVPELEPDRLVQPELMAERSNRSRRCVQAEQGPGRITGNQPQEQERDDDHAEHDGNREKDPAHGIAQSGTGEEPGRERRRAPGQAESGREAAREGSNRLVVAELGSAA